MSRPTAPKARFRSAPARRNPNERPVDPAAPRPVGRRRHDPLETAEWRDALLSLVRTRTARRACAVDGRAGRRWRATRRSAGSPSAARPTSTPSRSTQQPAFPGDLAIEERLASLMRWNALAMVVRANQAYGELGGHIASYASAADLFEVGFNHFFRARDATSGGDLVFFQPHCAPGVYARAFLEGRLSEARPRALPAGDPAPRSTARAASRSYPHPWLMPDFWQFPTGSMGIGPISSIYHARFMRYLHAPRAARLRGPQGVGRVRRRRDGRAREHERAHAGRAREARQPGLGGQLQPAAPRRPGARQRPHHRRAGDAVRRRRLERDQAGVGQRLGWPVRARHHRRAGARLRRHRRRPDADLRRQGRPLQPRHTSSARTRSSRAWRRA